MRIGTEQLLARDRRAAEVRRHRHQVHERIRDRRAQEVGVRLVARRAGAEVLVGQRIDVAARRQIAAVVADICHVGDPAAGQLALQADLPALLRGTSASLEMEMLCREVPHRRRSRRFAMPPRRDSKGSPERQPVVEATRWRRFELKPCDDVATPLPEEAVETP